MTKKTTIVIGVAAAAVATAIAVPAIAASSGEPARAQPSIAAYAVDTGALRDRLAAKVDAAVAGGWITPKLAAKLKEQLDAGERLLRPNTDKLEARLLAPFAKALGATSAELRAELRSGKTLDEILRAHGKTPDALFERLVDRLDERLGQAVGKGRLSQQRADTILERVEQRLGAWLERLLAQGS